MKCWRRKEASLGNPVPCPRIFKEETSPRKSKPLLRDLDAVSCNQVWSSGHARLKLSRSVVSPSVTELKFKAQISNVSSDQPEKMFKYCKTYLEIVFFWVSNKLSYLILYLLLIHLYICLGLRGQKSNKCNKLKKRKKWGIRISVSKSWWHGLRPSKVILALKLTSDFPLDLKL